MAVAVGAWTWSALTGSICEFGRRGTGWEVLAWCALVGLVGGAAFGLSGGLARERLRAGRPLQAAAVSIATWLALDWLAVMVAVAAAFATGCNRPF